MRRASAMSYPLNTPRRIPSRQRRAAPTVLRQTSSPSGALRRVPTKRCYPPTSLSFCPFGPLAATALAKWRRVEQQRLYELTVPGLAIDSEFIDIRRSLLAAFPHVVDVLPMRTPETLWIVYVGEDEIDAWCEALTRAVALRRRGLVPACQASQVR
jgi:hypothetical protein